MKWIKGNKLPQPGEKYKIINKSLPELSGERPVEEIIIKEVNDDEIVYTYPIGGRSVISTDEWIKLNKKDTIFEFNKVEEF